MIILLVIFALSYIGGRTGIGFDLLGWLIGVPATFLYRFVLTVTGLTG